MTTNMDKPMRLIISPPSPFVRKVRVLLRETGLIDQVEEVHVKTSPLASDGLALAANPTGKIPALIRHDGPAIYDSRVITRYLDQLAGADLYPQTCLFEILTLEATAEAIMEVGVGLTYDARYRAHAPAPEWAEAQWGKAARAITAINSLWMSHLHGPLNMAQIAVACALAYIDLRHDHRNWRNGNAALADWEAQFSERSSMVETRPE